MLDLRFTPDRVRRLRGSLSQQEFARVVGVSVRTVTYWEAEGEREPAGPVILARLLAIEQTVPESKESNQRRLVPPRV